MDGPREPSKLIPKRDLIKACRTLVPNGSLQQSKLKKALSLIRKSKELDIKNPADWDDSKAKMIRAANRHVQQASILDDKPPWLVQMQLDEPSAAEEAGAAGGGKRSKAIGQRRQEEAGVAEEAVATGVDTKADGGKRRSTKSIGAEASEPAANDQKPSEPTANNKKPSEPTAFPAKPQIIPLEKRVDDYDYKWLPETKQFVRRLKMKNGKLKKVCEISSLCDQQILLDPRVICDPNSLLPSFSNSVYNLVYVPSKA
jgi:hypothetical protein